MIRIGVDANGGDFGVASTVPGAIEAIKNSKDIEIVLFGDEEKIKPLLDNQERITIVNTKETISMGEEDPFRAVRRGKNTSLVLAMQASKDKEIDAVVTSGPTQAVVMAAHVIIKRIPEMERVALCPIIPNFDRKPRLLLDVGANVELKKEHFGEFAIFASVIMEELFQKKNPSVGYLNIGSEPGKGRLLDKEAYEYLHEMKDINFYGNVEANEALDAPCDIIVTEGYGGNILLKASEGTAKVMGRILKQEIKSSFGGKLGYLFMKKNLKRFAKRMDSSEVGGAMILGVGSPCIKAHGSSDPHAIAMAIKQAEMMVKTDIIKKAQTKISELKNKMKDEEGQNSNEE